MPTLTTPVECQQSNCPHFRTCCKLPTVTYQAPGRPWSDFMIIGQGAGWQEERDHFPWIGKAGQLLREVLRSIFKEHGTTLSVTLANTVRCRPTVIRDGRPADRPPNTVELQNCLRFLRRDIDLLKPRLLILAGASACSAFGIVGSMGSLRGKIHGSFFAIYHPAAVLREPNLGKELRHDLEAAYDYVANGIKLPGSQSPSPIIEEADSVQCNLPGISP